MSFPYLYTPSVFLAGDTYQIVVRLKEKGLLFAQVGDRLYADHTNGVVRSSGLTRKVTIPQAVLDAEKQYTLRFVPLAERTPYSPNVGQPVENTFAFRPVQPVTKERPLQMYMLADTHSRVTSPVKAAGYFGRCPDLLLLCGDIADKAQDDEHVDQLYAIIEQVTHGESPVVFTRGNHDTRGELAEFLPDRIGSVNGNTYFTFRAGSLWGVSLDCGEDKVDEHVEYGGKNGIAFYHTYRQDETLYLEKLAQDKPYEADGITTRIAFCHVPFTQTIGERYGIFDNERENHADWTQLLNQMGVTVLLSGHMHKAYFNLPGGENDEYGQKFVTVVGSDPALQEDEATMAYVGTAVTVEETGMTIALTNEKGETLSTLRLNPDGSVKA